MPHVLRFLQDLKLKGSAEKDATQHTCRTISVPEVGWKPPSTVEYRVGAHFRISGAELEALRQSAVVTYVSDRGLVASAGAMRQGFPDDVTKGELFPRRLREEHVSHWSVEDHGDSHFIAIVGPVFIWANAERTNTRPRSPRSVLCVSIPGIWLTTGHDRTMMHSQSDGRLLQGKLLNRMGIIMRHILRSSHLFDVRFPVLCPMGSGPRDAEGAMVYELWAHALVDCLTDASVTNADVVFVALPGAPPQDRFLEILERARDRFRVPVVISTRHSKLDIAQTLALRNLATGFVNVTSAEAVRCGCFGADDPMGAALAV